MNLQLINKYYSHRHHLLEKEERIKRKKKFLMCLAISLDLGQTQQDA
jgi:hypothetical protein